MADSTIRNKLFYTKNVSLPFRNQDQPSCSQRYRSKIVSNQFAYEYHSDTAETQIPELYP